MMENDVRRGWGKFNYGHGDEYAGYYDDDLKVYGKWAYANGEMRVCRWVLHESGAYSIIKGEGAKWSADRRTAWKLVDGELAGEISLDEAAAISARVGEGMPTTTPEAYVPHHDEHKKWATLKKHSTKGLLSKVAPAVAPGFAADAASP